MNEDDLAYLEDLWTTKRDSAALVLHESGDYSVFETSDGQLLFCLIEDSEVHDEVVRRMLEVGVQIFPHVKDALQHAKGLR